MSGTIDRCEQMLTDTHPIRRRIEGSGADAGLCPASDMALAKTSWQKVGLAVDLQLTT